MGPGFSTGAPWNKLFQFHLLFSLLWFFPVISFHISVYNKNFSIIQRATLLWCKLFWCVCLCVFFKLWSFYKTKIHPMTIFGIGSLLSVLLCYDFTTFGFDVKNFNPKLHIHFGNPFSINNFSIKKIKKRLKNNKCHSLINCIFFRDSNCVQWSFDWFYYFLVYK